MSMVDGHYEEGNRHLPQCSNERFTEGLERDERERRVGSPKASPVIGFRGEIVGLPARNTCEMYLRVISGHRCRRGQTTEWFGYRVCSQCAIALCAAGYPEKA